MSILTPPPSTALVPLVFVFCSLLATSGHCQSLLHSNMSIFELLSFGIFFIFVFSLYWPLQVIANLSCTQNTPNSIPAKKQSSDNLTDTTWKERRNHKNCKLIFFALCKMPKLAAIGRTLEHFGIILELFVIYCFPSNMDPALHICSVDQVYLCFVYLYFIAIFRCAGISSIFPSQSVHR